jgi:hypothetical protein
MVQKLTVSRRLVDEETYTQLICCKCGDCDNDQEDCNCENGRFNCGSLVKILDVVVEPGSSLTCDRLDKEKSIIKLYNGEYPHGIIVKEPNKGSVMFKFHYGGNEKKLTKFIKSTLFRYDSIDHIIDFVNPLLIPASLGNTKEEDDTYNVSLCLTHNTNKTSMLNIDVEHSELQRIRKVVHSNSNVKGMLMAKNDELSVRCDVDHMMIKCNLNDNDGKLLASISHDWSPFSDLVQYTRPMVSNIQGLQTLLQQKTRMLHPCSSVNAETETLYEMYNTCSDRLALGVSVIKSMKLISVDKEGKTTDAITNQNWVNSSCGITTSSKILDDIDHDQSVGANETDEIVKDQEPKISCLFSGSVRYAIAHKNKDITRIFMDNYGLTIEQVTSVLLSGIGSSASHSVPLNGFGTPCKQAMLLNNMNFVHTPTRSLELRRMNACRHAMGTDMDTFKINQNFIDATVFIHICNNDHGSCVFSVNNIRNLISVYLSPESHNKDYADIVAQKNVSFSSQQAHARDEYGNAANSLMRFRCVLSDIQDDDKPFNIHKAATQLAHLNTACIQNPTTALGKSLRYLRSCWFNTQILKLGIIYPKTVDDINYCRMTAKLKNMAKSTVGSSHFWDMVPFV